MTANVPTLGAVGDFGKLNCQPARIYNRSTKFQCTMLAPIAPNVCCTKPYLFYQNTITFPTSFLVSPFVEMSFNDSDLKSLEI